MSNVSLFALSKDQLELLELLESGIDENNQIDEFTEAALVINREQFAAKAVDYVAVIREKENNLDRVAQARAQLDAFEARERKSLESLKDRLGDAVNLFGPINAGFTKLSVRKSQSTIILDLDKVPAKFKKTVTKTTTTTSADKAAIKKAINAGEEVAGAELKNSYGLQMK